jgi:hypothetical protein
MKAKRKIKKRTIFYRNYGPYAKTSHTPMSRHIISRSEGEVMEQRFLESLKNISDIEFTYALEFDKSLFEQLLRLKGVRKIRIHNAVNANNQHTFVVTGVGTFGQQIYFKINQQSSDSQFLQKSAVAQTTTSVSPTADGVGNMADQCSQPGYKTLTSN